MLLFMQNDIETEHLVIDQIKPGFDTAMDLFRSVNRQDSQKLFEEVATELEQKDALNEDETLMLSECLKHLAILTFPEKTDQYFGKMIKLNPGCIIPAGSMSPKFIRTFNELKMKMTGSLLVNLVDAADQASRPLSGGRLLVDGQLMSIIENGIPIPVLAGTHQITVEMPNFDPLVQELEIVPSGTQSLNGIMYRHSADIGFITYPVGVKIFLDGVEQGLSDGVATPDYAEHLMAEGISPSQASSVFTLDNLKPGSYEVRFELPCFQTRKLSVPVEDLKSYRFKPVILQPSKAYLTVKTIRHTAGIVYLDNTRIGSLPLHGEQVCPGQYTLKVQFPDGQFIKSIALAEDDNVELIAKPQPSLAWFGILEQEGTSPDQPVNDWLHNLKTWNVLDIDATNSSIITHDPYELLFSGSSVEDDQARILTQSIKADLFVAARVVRQKTIIRFLEVAFWSPLSPKVKIYAIDFREMNKFQDLLTEIDQELNLLSPWLGIETIQLKGVNGLKILTIHPDGPLMGKANPGQLLTAINGALVSIPKEVLPQNYESMSLKIAGQVVQVDPVPTIIELPFVPKKLCPQAVIARLHKTGSYAEDPMLRASANFNRARYFFFMNDFQPAYDLFTNITLPDAFGISKGTLHFYQGLCFQKLNLNSEAAASFQEAFNYPAATLFGPDGPKAKHWADTQLSILTSP